MGGQQSKSEHSKPDPPEDDGKEKLTKSLSYHFNDEGTSVDNVSTILAQEMSAQEVPLPSTALFEEYPDTEPESSVMSGLPGETTPKADISVYLENTEEKEKKAHEKTGLPDKRLKDTEINTKPYCDTDSNDLNSYIEHPDYQDSSDTKQRCQEENQDTMIRQLEGSNQSHVRHLSYQGSVSGGGKDTQDGKLCTAVSYCSSNLKDIEMANENFCLPRHFDEKGLYKKKVTADKDDNRCICPVEDFDKCPFQKDIFTNVIFLPDKSKGASPKRYGPKRLGSIYDNISVDGDTMDLDEISLEDEFTLHAHSMCTVSESKTYSYNTKKFDSSHESSKVDRIDEEKRIHNQNNSANVQDQVNNPEELKFVEDHFGLYTGCLAEGISNEFFAKNACNEIVTELSQSIPLSDSNKGNSKDKIKQSGDVKLDVYSGNFKKPQHVERSKCVVQHTSDNVKISQNIDANTANTNEIMCRDTVKVEQKALPQILEQEVVETCKKCKEPGDLCLCLFPDVKTVMSVTVDEQKKPYFSYLRFLSIDKKEIHWSDLKSSQALFIKGLKSYKTEISGDNRVIFEFCLPAFKGFFGPYEGQSEQEKCDEDILDNSKSMVNAIEQKFKVKLAGTHLSESIDSNRNIMINDFDEFSDDEEEVSDDGDFNIIESDENNEKYHEKYSLTRCQSKVKITSPSEKVICAQNDDHLKPLIGLCLKTDFKYKNKKMNDSGLEHTQNENSAFNTGNTSARNSLNHTPEVKTYFEEDKFYFHDECTDMCNQECNSGGNSSQKSSNSLPSPFNEKENNDCFGFDKSSLTPNVEQQCSTENENLYPQKSGKFQIIVNVGELECARYEERETASCSEIEDHNHQNNFTKEKQDVIENYNSNEDNKNQTNSESENSVDVFKDSITQKRVREEFSLKKIKVCSKDDNRLKLDDENTDDNTYCHENDRQTTCTAGCHTYDKMNIQEQIAEESFDENQNVQIYFNSNIVGNTNSEGFTKDDSIGIRTVDDQFQKNVELKTVESERNRTAITDIELSESLDSESILDSLDSEEKIQQENKCMTNPEECNRENLSGVCDVVRNTRNKVPVTITVEKNYSRTQEALSDQKHTATLSGKTDEHLEAECEIDYQSKRQNEQCVLTGMAQALVSKLKKGNVVNNEVNYGLTNTGDSKNRQDERLTTVLKRKQTTIDVDNRLAEISSDEEDGYGTNVKKEETSERNEDDRETPFSFFPSSRPFSLGPLMGNLLKSEEVDFTLPPDEFLKQLQEKRAGLSDMFENMTTGNDLKFLRQSDELRKFIRERQFGSKGLTEKRQHKQEQHSRLHMYGHPKRPDNVKSDFASSFYDTSDKNIDTSKLGRETSTIFPTFDSEQRVTHELNGNLSSTNSSTEVPMWQNSSEYLAGSDYSSPSSRSESPVPSSHEEMAVGMVNDIWDPVIQQEKTTCLQNTRLPKNCRCTVLCVDVSASMRGSPWQQVQAFISDFLTGLEQKRQSDNVEEYVAMVTFGSETRIVSQPKNDYRQLTEVLKSFKPDGNSPLLPGLALSLLFQTVRKELGQHKCQVHDITLGHRIILVSDGRPSPSSEVGSSDEFFDEIQEQEAVQEVETSLQKWSLPSQHTHVDCVPVGESTNIYLLESVCKATNGRLVVPADVEVLVNSTHNHFIAAQVTKQMFQMKTDTLDLHMFKSLIQTLYPGRTSTDLEEMVTLVKTAHPRVMAQRLGSPKSMSTTSDDDVHFVPADLQGLPKIGSRVGFGPHVTEKLLNIANGKGTVTGHSRKHTGKVFVQWESGVHTLCNYGYKDMFEVIPDNTVEPCKIDDKIKIGYKVRRGPDWQYGNQDGGGDQLGTVYHIQKDGVLRVRWSNGSHGNYRYNQSGAFDVLISDPSDPFGIKLFESEMNKRNEEKSKTAEIPDPIGETPPKKT